MNISFAWCERRTGLRKKSKKKAMIGLLIFAVVTLGILIFRTSRLVQYFKEASTSSDAKARRIAYINFGIHLFVCLVIVYCIVKIVYGMFLMDS